MSTVELGRFVCFLVGVVTGATLTWWQLWLFGWMRTRGERRWMVRGGGK